MNSKAAIREIYVSLLITIGLATAAAGGLSWNTDDRLRFFAYLLIAILAAGLKVRLPGVSVTVSASFLFIFIGISQLSFSETLAIGCASALVQAVWRPKPRLPLLQVVFNLASMATAIGASYLAFHRLMLGNKEWDVTGPLVCAAVIFFVLNTLPQAGLISISQREPLRKIWRECYSWCFPYYLVGAAIAAVIHLSTRHFGWQTSLLVLPIVYVIHRSYHLYLARLEAEKAHAAEMAALHIRTIEALALAIEAKDETTHSHLKRVQVYALEIGKDLGLSDTELEALRAAALLHDIGKLAVPEHIISKPGRLAPDEFEKVKIHPVVGAEILNRVQFPYPVVPIVRSHHERWDGSGYPDGLQREEIPIGARILSAVDYLDALTSDRQYRRALPLSEAIEIVVAESGKSFDPRVVGVLKRRYAELEEMVQTQRCDRSKLSRGMKIDRGHSPAAGFECTENQSVSAANGRAVDFLSSIASARQEVQMIFELSRDLGSSLSLDETLSVLTVRLNRLIPYDTAVFYVCRDDVLVPAYVAGENFRLFSSLEIPMGEGLSGWVAANARPIVNGNPCVEPGYDNHPSLSCLQKSAVSVPLEGLLGFVGVLTLYSRDKDAFSRDHLRILRAISHKVALSIENSLRFRRVENSATTDFLTGLPNARSLFLQLDSELARARRLKSPLAVLVCDLNGFKQLNDQFGHLEGNDVLRRVAKALRESCREYDYVARMGGDEFVMLLPGLQPDSVHRKVIQLRELVLDVAGKSFLSMSVGEAFYTRDGDSADHLLAQADRRMYQDKERQKAEKRSHIRILKAVEEELSVH